MEWYFVVGMIMGTLAALLLIGMPIAVAFFTTNMIFAYFYLGGEVGFVQFVRSTVHSVGNFTLTPIPLFILMGELLFQTGMAARAIDAVDRIITRVPGRLAVVAVSSGTAFSTLTGSSLATVAMLGSSLVPDMTKRGYKPVLSAGPILATGGLAALIPPSGLAVLLGSLAGISISGLLLGGLVPGLIMASFFILYIVLRATFDRKSAPDYELPPMTLKERFTPFLLHVLPLFSVVFVVIGGLISGIATITEVAALGALGTFVLTICYRTLTFETFMRSMFSTMTVTVMIFMIIAASATFSQILAVTGVSREILGNLAAMELTPMTAVMLYLGIVLIMGCFLDPVAILMLTLPFFLPLVQSMDINMVWFGVLVLIALEMSFITPPFGVSIFVLKAITPPEMTTTVIYKAVFPFVLLQLGVIALLMFYPNPITWLPDMVRR